MRVVVIGAGLGGLAAAAHLVGGGHQVTVLERAARAGGRAGLHAEAGFRLDTGPTVLTLPELLDRTFAAAGRERAEYVAIDPVDPMYRAVFADGSALRVHRGREAMTDEIRGFAGSREAGAFNAFCNWLNELYSLEMPHFIDANFDSVLDLLKPWRAGLELIRLGGFGRLDEQVATFFQDDRLRRLFSFQSMYVGLSPHDALALYAVITYMNAVGGVFVPRGGMSALADGLTRALRDAGVDLRFDATVTRILRGGDGQVTGVEVADSDRIVADAVVCNADLPVAYRTLIGGVEAPRAARRGRYAPSCLLWVAGVRGSAPDDAAHHNVHFGAGWDDSFKAIIKQGRRMPDPTTFVTLPSITDPTLAPAGCIALSALEPVPNLDGKVDWSRDGARFADELRRRVGALGYPIDDVVVERSLDPLDWEATGLERGTPFALAHTFRQSGPFRPNNVDKRVPGLVFTGSSTRPGVGVPMVLISGKLAAERVDEYERTTSVMRW